MYMQVYNVVYFMINLGLMLLKGFIIVYMYILFLLQIKIRLEMNIERVKQQYNKELEEKEEEMEEFRYFMQKKVSLIFVVKIDVFFFGKVIDRLGILCIKN